jgi:hypothetical protein
VPFISVALPPGLSRNGTIYQSKGRYYDANLIRFRQGEIGPINGWQLRSATAAAFSGAARAIINWRDNQQPLGGGRHEFQSLRPDRGGNQLRHHPGGLHIGSG